MRISVFFMTIALVLAAVICQGVSAGEVEEGYYNSIASYYNVSHDVIADLREGGIADEELPVTLYVAKMADMNPQEIARQHIGGASWSQIVRSQNLDAGIFYFIVVGDIASDTYGGTFAKYSTTPQSRWGQIQLTDDEIVNLVNLRLISSHHDYSVFEIMAMRDSQSDFATINDQVRLIKEEMVKKSKRRKDVATAE